MLWQVESAFECVCDVVALINIRFARRMQVRSILVAESRQVGWIKGTNGVKLESIQKATNTVVDIERDALFALLFATEFRLCSLSKREEQSEHYNHWDGDGCLYSIRESKGRFFGTVV